MGKGVARAYGAARFPGGRAASDLRLHRFAAPHRLALNIATPVREGGTHVELVESVGDNWDQKDGQHERQREPEDQGAERLAEDAHILEAKEARVED